MEFEPQALSARDRYFFLTRALVPRPIGWISTVDTKGVANLAPFSFFGGVTSDPMTVMISIGRRRVRTESGEKETRHKDSAANLIATGEGVVHITSRELAEAMVQTSAEVAPDVDEFTLASLDRAASRHVAPPRAVAAPIAFEVRVAKHIEVGNTPVDLFLLEIVHAHVDDRILTDGQIDSAKLRPVGRLGGLEYCDIQETFQIDRPG